MRGINQCVVKAEETESVTSGAAGRPARLVRFRREVLLTGR